eukprot:1139125-Pelagomonas_calceolata.AAC.2
MASGDLEGYWKHLAPEPGCETYHCLQKSNPILRKEFSSPSVHSSTTKTNYGSLNASAIIFALTSALDAEITFFQAIGGLLPACIIPLNQ